MHEVARRCPLPINEATGLASQAWILHTQIAEEIGVSFRPGDILFIRSGYCKAYEALTPKEEPLIGQRASPEFIGLEAGEATC